MGFGLPIAITSTALGGAMCAPIKMKPVAPGSRALVSAPTVGLPAAPPAMSAASGLPDGLPAAPAMGLPATPSLPSRAPAGGGGIILPGAVATYLDMDVLQQLVENGTVELDVDVNLDVAPKRTHLVSCPITIVLNAESGNICIQALPSDLSRGFHVEVLSKVSLHDGDLRAKVKQKKKAQLKATVTDDPRVLTFGPNVDYSKHCDTENDIGEFRFSGIYIGCIE